MRSGFRLIIIEIRRGENIDIYIMFPLAFILAVLGIFGTIPSPILASAILATLGVLAFSMLETRRTLSELSQAISLLEPATKVLLKERKTLRPVRDDIERISTIWLCGQTLFAIFGANKDYFREMVQKGGNMRILIFNPVSSRLSILAELFGVSPSIITAEIASTIEHCKELRASGLGTGQFEIRQTEVMPGYSLLFYDPTEHSGQLVVEYTGYHTRQHERPHLEIDATRDRRWFTYYLKQFSELWESATPLS